MKKVLTFYVGLCFITLSYAQNENPQSKSTTSNKVVTPSKSVQTNVIKSNSTKEMNGVTYQRLDSKPISGADPRFIKNQTKNNSNQPLNTK